MISAVYPHLALSRHRLRIRSEAEAFCAFGDISSLEEVGDRFHLTDVFFFRGPSNQCFVQVSGGFMATTVHGGLVRFHTHLLAIPTCSYVQHQPQKQQNVVTNRAHVKGLPSTFKIAAHARLFLLQTRSAFLFMFVYLLHAESLATVTWEHSVGADGDLAVRVCTAQF